MANDDLMDCGLSSASPAAVDAREERMVLGLILELHPDQLTNAELSQALVDADDDFGAKDAVDRALQELVGAGLLRRQVESVLPTRSALHFHRLWGLGRD